MSISNSQAHPVDVYDDDELVADIGISFTRDVK